VPEDGAQRDAGAGGDLLGGGRKVALLLQGQQRVDHAAAGALPAGGAAVDRLLLVLLPAEVVLRGVQAHRSRRGAASRVLANLPIPRAAPLRAADPRAPRQQRQPRPAG
jgi:hypothetical protein